TLQQAESERLRSASAIRAMPCRSAGYGTRTVRVKLPVSCRPSSWLPASGGGSPVRIGRPRPAPREEERDDGEQAVRSGAGAVRRLDADAAGRRGAGQRALG